MAYGIGTKLKSAIWDKKKLNEETGLTREAGASEKDIWGSRLGVDAGSKYGYDGRELSEAEQRAQGSNVFQAVKPQQFKLAVKVGTKVGGAAGGAMGKMLGMIPKVFNATFGKIFTNKTVIAKLGPLVAKKAAENTTKKLPNIIVKLLKSALTKLTGSALGKIVAKIARRFVSIASGIGTIIEIAILLKAFIEGIANTKRMFGLANGAAPSLWMYACAGIGSVVGELIFGLISPKTIATTIYGLFAGTEEKEATERFKKFLDQKAKILGVDSSRLQEYETKALLGAWFSSDKKDAALLQFKDIEEYKKWRDGLFKPVDEMRKTLVESYGGKSVVETLVHKTPDGQEKQEAYRAEFLKRAQAMANAFFKTKGNDEDKLSDTDEDGRELSDEERAEKEAADSGEQPKNPADLAVVAGAAGATIAAATTAGAEALGPGGAGAVADVASGGQVVDAAAKAASSTTAVAGGAGTVAGALGAGLAGGTALVEGVARDKSVHAKPAEKKKEGEYTLTDWKRADNNNPFAALESSILEMQTELEALNEIHKEQVRHNKISEKTMANLSKQIQLMLEISDRQDSKGAMNWIRNKIDPKARARKEAIKQTSAETQQIQADVEAAKTPATPLNDSKEEKSNKVNVNDVVKINGNATDTQTADAGANAGSGGVAVLPVPAGGKKQTGATGTQQNSTQVASGFVG